MNEEQTGEDLLEKKGQRETLRQVLKSFIDSIKNGESQQQTILKARKINKDDTATILIFLSKKKSDEEKTRCLSELRDVLFFLEVID